MIITIAPLLMGLAYSLMYSLGLVGLMNKGFTLNHWINLFKNSIAINSMGYSFLLTIISLIFTLFLALGLSWELLKSSKQRFYKSLFIPLLFPPLIAAFAWFYLLTPGGILARISFHLGLIKGIEEFPRLVNDYYSFGIVITHVFLIFPLFTLLFVEQSRKERMPELMQSSQTLGSSNWHFFYKIYAPLLLLKSKPLIWLYGIFLLGTYEVPMLLGRSSPRVVTVFITDKLTRFNLDEIPLGHTMSILYSLIILGIVSLFISKKTSELF